MLSVLLFPFLGENVAISLLQIGCALVGSLGALYNGVLLINLAIALFALVAIESSSQSLGRTYAVLLFCAILLDISWFILFSRDIWCVFFVFSFSVLFLFPSSDCMYLLFGKVCLLIGLLIFVPGWNLVRSYYMFVSLIAFINYIWIEFETVIINPSLL